MRHLLKLQAVSLGGWVGDRPEQEWARFVQRLVETKLAKLARPEFQKFGQNWLSVYDNLPLPNVHLGDAIRILRILLEDCWSCEPAFDTLFIERGPVIAKITARESEHLMVEDLWPGQ